MFDEVDVWLPDVSMVVQSVQSRVPVFVFLFVFVFIHSAQIWVPEPLISMSDEMSDAMSDKVFAICLRST